MADRSEKEAEDGPVPEGDGPLQRWSRRKAQAREGVDPDADPPASQETQPAATADPGPTDADMPPVAELDEDSDLSAFFAPGVSEELRQAALRRLFRGAKFNRRDGLEVYDEDYRSFERLGEVLTADLRHRMERRAQQAMADPAPGTGEEAAPDGAPPDGEDAEAGDSLT